MNAQSALVAPVAAPWHLPHHRRAAGRGRMAGWREAVGVLARERELAESGAGLLKAYAGRGAAGMPGAQKLYAAAKAASDGLIERLLLAVREGDDPARSADLEAATGEAV